MSAVDWGSAILAALVGSAVILVSMYILLPALGLPKLDFTAVTGGWVRATGKYAKLVGSAVFVAGGIVWAIIYAAYWPWHSVPGGMIYGMVPFAIASMLIMPQLNQFRLMVAPLPGFIWVKVGGPTSMFANLIEHLIFGLCLGIFYR